MSVSTSPRTRNTNANKVSCFTCSMRTTTTTCVQNFLGSLSVVIAPLKLPRERCWLLLSVSGVCVFFRPAPSVHNGGRKERDLLKVFVNRPPEMRPLITHDRAVERKAPTICHTNEQWNATQQKRT